MSEQDTLLSSEGKTTSVAYAISYFMAAFMAAIKEVSNDLKANENDPESKPVYFEVTDENKIIFSQNNQREVFLSFSSDEFAEDQKERCIQVTNRLNQFYEIEKHVAKEEQEYSNQLDDIFDKLHIADDRIAEIRQNTVRLGIETRSMLDDLRKQLG